MASLHRQHVGYQRRIDCSIVIHARNILKLRLHSRKLEEGVVEEIRTDCSIVLCNLEDGHIATIKVRIATAHDEA